VKYNSYFQNSNFQEADIKDVISNGTLLFEEN